MKWILSTLFLVALYLFSFVFYFNENAKLDLFFGILLIIISLINIIYLFIYACISSNLEKSCNDMRKMMLFIKLLSIPFFIMNFLIWSGFYVVFTGLPGGILTWVFIPLLIFITFIILLITSSFSITAIILYARFKKLKKHEVFIHIVLQLIFVIDIVDTIYLFKILHKRDLNHIISDI